ncbi:hypothetical protein vseg_018629 [Gypsophila vaccaria]
MAPPPPPSPAVPTAVSRALVPSLDTILKIASWRRHPLLHSSCKSSLHLLLSLPSLPFLSLSSPPPPPLKSSLESSSAAELSAEVMTAEPVVEEILTPLILALETDAPKIVEVALGAVFRLLSRNLLRFSLSVTSYDGSEGKTVIWRLFDSICKCVSLGDEVIEFSVLKTLLAAVRSPKVRLYGECMDRVVRICYDVYLGGRNGTNMICAKAVLAQIVLIVFTRVEEDSMSVNRFRIVSVSELLEFTDRNLSEGNSVQLAQSVIMEVMLSNEGVYEESDRQSENLSNGGDELRAKLEEEGSRLREDGLTLFKNLCKLSTKFSSQGHSDDGMLLRGKILSLELLKVIMDNGGPVWGSNERFTNVIKQSLCLSLLKNSASSVMTIFQLLCSIFVSLLLKFRSGLKAEIGTFFPMLILRVLENVVQPNFIQKMTVFNILGKITQDPQLVIDIFVNYDCDLDALNIFERTINGLLKTALGPPSGSKTTLSPVQDLTFRVESVKCLVIIVKSMGSWMDQQMKSGDSSLTNKSEMIIGSADMHSVLNAGDLQSESNSELLDDATLEQHRAYKLEMRKGVSLFNTKPSKGIDFLIKTKKVGGSPEAVASFLKNEVGLNPTVIGDYLGEPDNFLLKVMHAYVNGFNFEKMDFGEAIRYFLLGFRLPGEDNKIDRIIEKFAERYYKCNPSSFKSADTAYALAYSVIMLSSDHSSMDKDKMTKADFVWSNRGIDDGKDLPEEYLSALYDQIVKNEIKMSAENFQRQSKQVEGISLLGLDKILNSVIRKQAEEKPFCANELLLKNIQEQFKAKSGNSKSFFYAVSDISILGFMVEVCWGPMLAAFSMTLDRSDDKLATSECMQGFRYSVHVTAVLGMQTQRDAFLTSLAKFTYLHCAADMKQKNVDAMKTIMTIAIEDGNFLQEAWEHILTCLSRFERLQLIGEGVSPHASFRSISEGEAEPKKLISSDLASYKKKGALHNPTVAAVVQGWSYDSSARGVNSSKLVTPDQVNNLFSNLHLLDQIGTYELNHIFAHSQSLNSEAIVSFVRALCKVSMSELQSPNDPRVFSLTKIVEIAHYNMNRIRLVWSRIWNVLSEFFVSVGLSDNLSVAIFVIDSLRQLAMKFLEREELANFNFQNEFLRPFVIVIRKSSSTEIRELIIRCTSQMVLSRARNVKSGWKSVFMVFTTAAADEQKSIVLLAFEIMEKIVREYFLYITDTESAIFIDCINCLITFTNCKYNSDVSCNAIALLRFCALKLAEGGLLLNDIHNREEACGGKAFDKEDENISFWMPLLIGLSKLTSDPRSAIRMSALEGLFDILMDHGTLFSRPFWNVIFKFVVVPIFGIQDDKDDNQMYGDQSIQSSRDSSVMGSAWDSETYSVAAERLIDLFVTFLSAVRSQLPNAIAILMGFIKNPSHGPAKAGMSALERLTCELGARFSEDDWRGTFMALKDAAGSTTTGFLELVRTMDTIEIPDAAQTYINWETSSDHEKSYNDLEDDSLQTAAYVVSSMKSHISVQLVIIQVVADLFKTHHDDLSPTNIKILLGIFSMISSHAHQLNSGTVLIQKLQRACEMLELSQPPLVHFENESFQSYLNLLNDLLVERASISDDIDLQEHIFGVCEKILKLYLDSAGTLSAQQKPADQPMAYWILPLPSAKREELTARTPLLLSGLRTLSNFKEGSVRRYISRLFPLLIDLVRSEHSSGEVPCVLSDMFQTCLRPLFVES